MPSICIASRSSEERSEAIQCAIQWAIQWGTRSADSATKRRDTADFDRPSPFAAGTPPTGSRTARPNLRIETLISIRFIAHWPSQSSARAVCQLGSASSAPERPRT